ncbi:hypothetical protein LINGRAHAP2_LOCUS25848, partial [Linum grandiflorum]
AVRFPIISNPFHFSFPFNVISSAAQKRQKPLGLRRSLPIFSSSSCLLLFPIISSVMNGDGRAGSTVKDKDKLAVLMCGYLPGALPQRSPISSPVVVRSDGFGWKDVCGGGCGFAMAISDSGKLITWGSTDDLGQSYLTSGKHGEIPEPFPLPTGATLTRAAAGWAHCVASTDIGEVYTWGWKECIPSGKIFGEPSTPRISENDNSERHGQFVLEQVSTGPQVPKSGGGSSDGDTRGVDESKKRRRISAKQTAESSSSGDDLQSALPCLVTLSPGVRIVNVAAGGRHTLALSACSHGRS